MPYTTEEQGLYHVIMQFFCCCIYGVTLYDLNQVDDAYIRFCADKNIPDDPTAKERLLLDFIAVRDGFALFGEEVDKQHILLATENTATLLLYIRLFEIV
jgi:hypothetical protein